jgi:hypothetical protein
MPPKQSTLLARSDINYVWSMPLLQKSIGFLILARVTELVQQLFEDCDRTLPPVGIVPRRFGHVLGRVKINHRHPWQHATRLWDPSSLSMHFFRPLFLYAPNPQSGCNKEAVDHTRSPCVCIPIPLAYFWELITAKYPTWKRLNGGCGNTIRARRASAGGSERRNPKSERVKKSRTRTFNRASPASTLFPRPNLPALVLIALDDVFQVRMTYRETTTAQSLLSPSTDHRPCSGTPRSFNLKFFLSDQASLMNVEASPTKK